MHLCGVGVTGIVHRDDLTEYDWKQLKYAAINGTRSIADELDLPYAKNVTTVKPSGCRTGDGLLTTKEGLLTLDELDYSGDWKAVDNLTILQDSGTNNKALKTFYNGLAKTITVKMSYGMEVTCTPDHKWYVSRRNRKGSSTASSKFKPQWVSAEELLPGRDFIHVDNNIFNETPEVILKSIEQSNYNNTQTIINQPQILNEEISWLLGYLWGDGSLSPSKHRIRFIDENRFNLENVQSILSKYFNIQSNINPASEVRNAEVLEVGCKNLWNWIIENGFYKYKEDSTLNNIPKNIRRNKNLIIAFIAGLIDSDGCLSNRENKYSFIISTSQDSFSKHLQDVCWSVGLGIGRSLNTEGKNFQKTKHMWLMSNAASYTNKDSFNILARNSNKIQRLPADTLWNFEDVKRISVYAGRISELVYNDTEVQTYDLEVENNHWYYAGALKSHNTLSKIMDTTEGVHKPLGKYIFNWVNFSKNDPLVNKLYQANYRVLDNPSDDTSALVCMPVYNEGINFTTVDVTRKTGETVTLEINKESAIEQLERYKKLQIYYCEQNVSNTISYDISEVDSIVDWLLENWDIYVGVSFLFRADPTLSAKDLGYEYLPQEVVTKERYDKYVASLDSVDFSNTDTLEEITQDECASGACPIK